MSTWGGTTSFFDGLSSGNPSDGCNGTTREQVEESESESK
jgi:hypothetical protein